MSPRPQLVLASTSPWRKELLTQLGLPFLTVDPELDESPWHARGLPPADLVRQLACAKARAAAQLDLPENCLVLGADQVACIGDRILLKPGTRERALEQLGLLAGKTHELLTAIALLDTRTGALFERLDVESLRMRDLSPSELANYVDREDVLGCAGSYRIEGLGIALFESVDGPDWTGVVGLPLLSVVNALAEAGISPLS